MHVDLIWKCSNRLHRPFPAAPSSVIHGNSWCRRCYEEKHSRGAAQRHTIDKPKKFARSMGGKCLSPTYENNWTKMDWWCGACRIEFSRSWDKVRGRWCQRTCPMRKSSSKVQ
jgi:hypothetical protein